MRKSGKQIVPTSTAIQVRILLWQPTQRPVYQNGVWNTTAWGRCRVTGRLGQRHADITETMLSVAEKRRMVEDGGVELLVDPAKVRRNLSDSGYSHSRMWSLLREIMAATVEIETKNFRALGHLIDDVIESPATRPDPLTGGIRHLWRVRLGKLLVALLEIDLPLYYDPAPIARLEHGISQAIARHCLSHKTQPRGGWTIDGLIQTVSRQPLPPQVQRKAKFLLKADSEDLNKIGIIIDGDRVIKNG